MSGLPIFWTMTLLRSHFAMLHEVHIDLLTLARWAGLALSLSVFLCLNRKI